MGTLYLTHVYFSGGARSLGKQRDEYFAKTIIATGKSLVLLRSGRIASNCNVNRFLLKYRFRSHDLKHKTYIIHVGLPQIKDDRAEDLNLRLGGC